MAVGFPSDIRMFLSSFIFDFSFSSYFFSRLISFDRIFASNSRFCLYFSTCCSCAFWTDKATSGTELGSRNS